MSSGDDVQWRHMWKFPGFEVSTDHQVRNADSKMLVRQRLGPFGRVEGARVLLPRGYSMVEVFVQELVYEYFPELRGLRITLWRDA